MKKMTRVMIAVLILCTCLVFVMFYSLIRQYRQNSAAGGAAHLVEINHQGRENIVTLLSQEQNLSKDIEDEIESGLITSEDQLMTYIRDHKIIWNADDLYVYTEAGICLNAGGAAQNNGDASEFAYETLRDGETFRIVKSQIEYACAVNTDLTIQGSRVVAVSVMNNLDTLLDDLNFRPFGDAGSVYLTRQNGVRICQTSGEKARTVYNVTALFEEGTLEKLSGSGDTLSEAMTAGSETVFLYTGTSAPSEYVVVTPIDFMRESLYLFTIVPQSVVNLSMNEFSTNVTLLSFSVIVLIIALFAGFALIYQRRAQAYSAEIHSRERLFDLLVSETSNAYMLLETEKPAPVYLSSNAEKILGVRSISLRRLEKGYCLTSGQDAESPAIEEINSALCRWDGKQPFASGYLPYSSNRGSCYLQLNLYPTAEGRSEYVGIIRDATPEYRREKNLEDALALANSANRAKTRFLSSMSHDIRTPLNAIINMARFLKQDLGNRGKAEGEIDVIRQSSEHLLGLINDVLDLSRIESGKTSFRDEPFDMHSVLDGVCEIIRPLCNEKKQRFTYSAENILHFSLTGDPLRLNQILINILNNAVKFTPNGGEVGLSVAELPSIRAGSVPFRFVVRDTGIGIPAESLQSIFIPFSRADSDEVRRTEGTGLGLAITKNFVEAQGGTIRVESCVGQGSVFTVELCYNLSAAPAAPLQPAPETAVSTARFDGLRALLAEDNDINMEIAVTILTGWGFAVDRAGNGKAAADLFAASPEGWYSAIYLDIQMPVMDGYEAARAIRGSSRRDAGTVSIIAMTANAFSEDVERARAAGMNAHVSKPIDPEEVRRITAKLLGRSAES